MKTQNSTLPHYEMTEDATFSENQKDAQHLPEIFELIEVVKTKLTSQKLIDENFQHKTRSHIQRIETDLLQKSQELKVIQSCFEPLRSENAELKAEGFRLAQENFSVVKQNRDLHRQATEERHTLRQSESDLQKSTTKIDELTLKLQTQANQIDQLKAKIHHFQHENTRLSTKTEELKSNMQKLTDGLKASLMIDKDTQKDLMGRIEFLERELANAHSDRRHIDSQNEKWKEKFFDELLLRLRNNQTRSEFFKILMHSETTQPEKAQLSAESQVKNWMLKLLSSQDASI